MNTIELTTTEFRRDQKKYLDLAIKGVSIVIFKGKDMFLLNHIPAENRFDPQTMREIENARLQFAEGKTTSVKTRDELDNLLDSL